MSKDLKESSGSARRTSGKKSIPGKGNSKAGVCLVCLKNSRKLVWLEQWELEGGPWKMGRGSKDPIICRLVGHCRDCYFLHYKTLTLE